MDLTGSWIYAEYTKVNWVDKLKTSQFKAIYSPTEKWPQIWSQRKKMVKIQMLCIESDCSWDAICSQKVSRWTKPTNFCGMICWIQSWLLICPSVTNNIHTIFQSWELVIEASENGQFGGGLVCAMLTIVGFMSRGGRKQYEIFSVIPHLAGQRMKKEAADESIDVHTERVGPINYTQKHIIIFFLTE